ncbi:MAG: DUF4861 family protein [Paludibacteraceae bacterium]|nr:DUF4861 family protein [Paludibacteraceae bacterium]
MNRYFLIAALLLCLVSCQTEVQQRVYGRYVSERKDDFAWENEYAAFRMYGPALAPENPSNGVDLWLKVSPELVVDSFYYREHVLGLPYHINYGKGLDCYKVGHTCGAGGPVVLASTPHADGETEGSAMDFGLFVGGAYDRWEILEQTPDKLVFRLEYDRMEVNGNILQESITITAEAGHMLNRADVVLRGECKEELWVGGGIYLHDGEGEIYTCDHCGVVALAEDALSDKTAAQMNYEYNGSTSQGRSYIAVITPNGGWQDIKDGTLFSVQPYNPGDTMTYYFGACWSEWRNGEEAFPTDEDWFAAIKR